ncbi:hypothetical protein NFI96_003210 [Prochilodus magdalenae]|nr:hypothetical protein NFI96_003210 [Prochilodus magdalenae]
MPTIPSSILHWECLLCECQFGYTPPMFPEEEATAAVSSASHTVRQCRRALWRARATLVAQSATHKETADKKRRLGQSFRPATSSDPCSNYTALDNPWRGTNTTIQLDICDHWFNWTGWYRMLYFGSNIRMPESCVSEYRCGTAITMWMNGLHPQTADGIVSRGICGRQGVNCCAVSYTIRVKACPGNYYVYEFVKPICSAAYCADVSTITPRIDPTTATDTAVLLTGGVASDPCTDYSVFDEEWRVIYGLSYSIYRGHDDTVAKWSGWYRLYLQGNSAQIPEPDWCASYLTCGGYTPLLLGGAHPLPEDGIVTRDVYGSYGYVIDSKLCNSQRSYPIQVKACPGDYYVYKLVQPTVGFPRPTYCAVALDTPSIDPCNSYTSLDQPWRGTNATGGTNCDLSFNGTGWYRLMYKGMNIRMPESCVASSKCGTATSLWLNGSHPQTEDGIVVLRVCGRSGTDCCYYRSTPVRVKACPGNYYVYQLFSTTFCDAAYCADVTTITPISTTTVASSTQSTTSTNLYMTNSTTMPTTTVASGTELTTSTELYMTDTTTITPSVVSSTELTTSTELYMTDTTTITPTAIVASSTQLTTSTELYMTDTTTMPTTTVASSTEQTMSTELYMTETTTITPTATVASGTELTTSTELYMTDTTTIMSISAPTVASSTELTTSTELYMTDMTTTPTTTVASSTELTTSTELYMTDTTTITPTIASSTELTTSTELYMTDSTTMPTTTAASSTELTTITELYMTDTTTITPTAIAANSTQLTTNTELYMTDSTTMPTTTVASSTELTTSTQLYMADTTTIIPTTTVASSTELTTSTELYMTDTTTIMSISAPTVTSSTELTTSTELYITDTTTMPTTTVASSTELTTSTELYMTDTTTITPTIASSTELTTSTELYMTDTTTMPTTTLASSTELTTSTELYMTDATTITATTTVASSTELTTSTEVYMTDTTTIMSISAPTRASSTELYMTDTANITPTTTVASSTELTTSTELYMTDETTITPATTVVSSTQSTTSTELYMTDTTTIMPISAPTVASSTELTTSTELYMTDTTTITPTATVASSAKLTTSTELYMTDSTTMPTTTVASSTELTTATELYMADTTTITPTTTVASSTQSTTITEQYMTDTTTITPTTTVASPQMTTNTELYMTDLTTITPTAIAANSTQLTTSTELYMTDSTTMPTTTVASSTELTTSTELYMTDSTTMPKPTVGSSTQLTTSTELYMTDTAKVTPTTTLARSSTELTTSTELYMTDTPTITPTTTVASSTQSTTSTKLYMTDTTTIMPVSTTTVANNTQSTTSNELYMTNATTMSTTTVASSSTKLTTNTELYMTNVTTIMPTTTVASSTELTTSTKLNMTNTTTITPTSTVASSAKLTTSTEQYMTDTTTIMPVSTPTVANSTQPTTSNNLYMTNMTTITPVSTTTVASSTQSTTSTKLSMSNTTTITPTTTVANNTQSSMSTELYMTDPNITGSAECKIFTMECADILFSRIGNITAEVLSPQVVTELLDMVVNTQEQILNVAALNTDTLVSYGNTVLNRTEKLMSLLVKPTDTNYSVNISLNGLDAQVIAVGPNSTLTEPLQLRVNSAQMEIYLSQISMNNNGSAAVDFMSFTNMAGMLKPSFFRTATNTEKMMMSDVVSATLPRTVNTQLSKPVKFTFKHLTEIYPPSIIYCVHWNNAEWVVDGCERLQTNITHTVCSCTELSTLALIMQINPPTGDNSDPLLDLLNMIAVAVGLVFLSLALLTFALCRRNLSVNIAPLINLCISLFLAHLLFLLTQGFLQHIRADQVVCAVLAGVLHFLYLSAFVWMFIEAVLLFISLKNLTNIRSKQIKVLSWKYMTVIGYLISLSVVGVSAGLFPDGYGSKRTLVFKIPIQIVILGCPWIVGFFTQDSKVLEIIFLFLNSQQGTFIFLVYCVFNHEVCSPHTSKFQCLTFGGHSNMNSLSTPANLPVQRLPSRRFVTDSITFSSKISWY